MSGVQWADALALMRRTYANTAEGRQFVANGTTPLAHATHMLDLAGAALATSRVAAAVGDAATHAQFLTLSRFGLSAFNASSCMLREDGKKAVLIYILCALYLHDARDGQQTRAS